MKYFPTPLAAVAFAALVNLAPLRAIPPGDWKLAFADEFDGDQLDRTKWSTTMEFAGTHGPRYHNEYYLSYTVDEDVIVSDGLLRLRTDRRTVSGAESPGIFNYTQGLVSSHDKFAFTHGYVEIRAKFPGGKGLWPCLWLMPQHQGWPPEYDIAEYYAGQRTMHHGLAYGGLYSAKWDSIWDSTTDFESDWHTFALEWGPGRSTWFVDGVPRKIIEADYVPSVPMYVILSNSISSVFGPSGAPDAATVFPNFFLIDYVRIYQSAATPPEIPVEPPVTAPAAAAITAAPPEKAPDDPELAP